ncbi:MAG: YraN family protein [Methylococcaceae bacterium]
MKPLKPPPSITGQHIEDLASTHLQERGLHLLERNFRCRQGEIDLIMTHGDVLTFIEVRYRKNDYYGSPLESVTPQKRAKIITTAQYYLLQNPQASNQPMRFDVVAASSDVHGNINFDWVQDAFQEN